MSEKYKDEFMDSAMELEKLLDQKGNVVELVLTITKNLDDIAIQQLINKLASLSDNSSNEVKRKICLVKDNLVKYYGYVKISNITKDNDGSSVNEKTLPELLEELHNLVGLDKVKSKVEDLIAYQKVRELRKKEGLKCSDSTLHLAFTGNPGTGKTTVARILGHIYKQLGLLSKGHFIEVSRTDLIAGYQGQTALKVKAVIEQALGGVLFIDEAYSITENEHSDSYGRECLTELTKALEDYRNDLVVIVAGYTQPMNKFFESNQGLKSRFNAFIEFDNYSSVELKKILISLCENDDYIICDGLRGKVRTLIEKELKINYYNFANGRFVRNIYENIVMNHAKRVSKIDTPSIDQLKILASEDWGD